MELYLFVDVCQDFDYGPSWIVFGEEILTIVLFQELLDHCSHDTHIHQHLFVSVFQIFELPKNILILVRLLFISIIPLIKKSFYLRVSLISLMLLDKS
jgi:hypothetical protein